MTDLRTEAASVLAPLCDLAAPLRPGGELRWDELVRVGEHQLHLASSCAASLAHEGEFDGWRSAFARRRVGLRVLERLRRPGAPTPGVAAAQAVEDLAAEGRDSFSQWLSTLGPGGRATAVREGVGYAVSARAALAEHGAWPPEPGTRFVDSPFRWTVPGRGVQLEGRADSVVRKGPNRYLLVLAAAEQDEAAVRRSIAWTALVCALATGATPRGVTRFDLDAGTRRHVRCTDDVLDDGLTAAAATVEAAMAARYAPPAPTTPGPWCRGCRGRDACPDAV